MRYILQYYCGKESMLCRLGKKFTVYGNSTSWKSAKKVCQLHFGNFDENDTPRFASPIIKKVDAFGKVWQVKCFEPITISRVERKKPNGPM